MVFKSREWLLANRFTKKILHPYFPDVCRTFAKGLLNFFRKIYLQKKTWLLHSSLFGWCTFIRDSLSIVFLQLFCDCTVCHRVPLCALSSAISFFFFSIYQCSLFFYCLWDVFVCSSFSPTYSLDFFQRYVSRAFKTHPIFLLFTVHGSRPCSATLQTYVFMSIF